MQSAHAILCTSIVDSAHKPASAHAVVINAIHPIARQCFSGTCDRILHARVVREPIASYRSVAGSEVIARSIAANLDVPLVMLPSAFAPPISRSAPRTRSGDHFRAHAAKRDAHGTLFAQFDLRSEGWP